MMKPAYRRHRLAAQRVPQISHLFESQHCGLGLDTVYVLSEQKTSMENLLVREGGK